MGTVASLLVAGGAVTGASSTFIFSWLATKHASRFLETEKVCGSTNSQSQSEKQLHRHIYIREKEQSQQEQTEAQEAHTQKTQNEFPNPPPQKYVAEVLEIFARHTIQRPSGDLNPFPFSLHLSFHFCFLLVWLPRSASSSPPLFPPHPRSQLLGKLSLCVAWNSRSKSAFGVGSARWPDARPQSGGAHGFSLISISGVGGVVDEGKTGGKAENSGTPRSDMVRGWDDFRETHRIAQIYRANVKCTKCGTQREKCAHACVR